MLAEGLINATEASALCLEPDRWQWAKLMSVGASAPQPAITEGEGKPGGDRVSYLEDCGVEGLSY